MQKIYSLPRRSGKTSRARAAIRVLRKAGYTWDNGIWQAPERSFLTLTMRECDIDRIKAEWQHAIAKAPCADMRLQPYQEKYIRKANGLHQIAEPDVQEAPAAVEAEVHSEPEAMPLDEHGIAPCPLCGSKSKHVKSGESDGHRILCWSDECECSSGYFFDKEAAISSWNSRAKEGK